MTRSSLVSQRRLGVTLSIALAIVGSGAAQRGSQKEAPVRFSATAVDLDAPPGGVTTPVEILVERWSTDAERDQVMNAIVETGQNKLLSVLQKLARVGSIRTPASVGWDIRYARHAPGSDGRDQITMLTDRPISFYEVRNQTRSVDYPFTVIDLRIGSNGRGEGKLIIGAKLIADKEARTLVIENYTIQPVMLNNVRREQ
jgi:hypothetical protein